MGNWAVWPLQHVDSKPGWLSLWKWNSGSTPSLDVLASICTPQRRAKALRYKYHADRFRCLAVGALLRDLVLRTTGEVLQTESHFPSGKPYLPEFPDLEISISHSGDWVACALARAGVGIDVEYDDEAHFKKDSWPPSCRNWTNCEAFLKYHGLGLSVSPEVLQVHRGSDQTFYVENPLTHAFGESSIGQLFGFDFAVDERHWLSVYGAFLPVELGEPFASPIL